MISMNQEKPIELEQKTQNLLTISTPSTQTPRKSLAVLSLRDMRQHSGLTGADAAKLCHTTYRSLRNWESGVSIPNIINVVELLNVYGFTIEQLDMAPFYEGVNNRAGEKKKNQVDIALKRLDEMRRQHTPDAP